MNISEIQLSQYEVEIGWLKRRIDEVKSSKQKREYQHQIRKIELEIAFNS